MFLKGFREDLIKFTESTTTVISGFQLGLKYMCVLSTMSQSGKISEYIIPIEVKSLGKSLRIKYFCNIILIILIMHKII